jgi:hypothetical protein
MDHVHNLDAWLLDAVENQIFRHRKAAIARPQPIALAASLREVSQQPEMVCQQVNETVGGWLVRMILRDASPNSNYILARPPGEAVGGHQCCCCSCLRSARASRFSSLASCGKVASV